MIDIDDIVTPRDAHFQVHAEAYRNLHDGYHHLAEATKCFDKVKQFLIDELNETPEFGDVVAEEEAKETEY